MSKKAFLLSSLFLCLAAPSRAEPVWEIGRHDNQNAEFALAPDRYGEFGDDGFFVVGQSDPREDWPYVHPGPQDGWAGGRPHTFTIVFGLTSAPTLGPCKLLCDLVDTQGRLVAGENGPLVVPQTVGAAEVAVAPDGTVLAGGQSIGRLRVVEFADRAVLTPAGARAFRAPAGMEPDAAGNVAITQAHLEGSNVNAMEEMVQMVDSLRTFQACYKIVQVQDELNAKAVNELARV